MKNKRVISCFLIIVLLLSLALTSCGSTNKGNTDDGGTKDPGETTTPVPGGAEEEHTHQIVEYSRVEPTYTEAGKIVYKCTSCDYEITDTIPMLTHSFGNEFSYDDNTHWYPCLDEGYTDLKSGEEAHGYELVEDSSNDDAEYATYSCKCGHTVSRKKTVIVTLPTVVSDVIYVGQTLSAFTLTGGEANVEGSFAWANGNTVITESGDYQVIFTPADTGEYASLAAVVHLDATQLTVTVTVGEHGSADPLGTVNVNYGDALAVTFKADLGYAVSSVTLDGASVEASGKYTVSDIKESHTLHAEFEKSESTVSISCMEGSDGCYSIDGTTITFASITADSVYAISGELIGNIVIDVSDDYKFELEMQGLTVWCEDNSPIVILNGDKVTLTAKKDYDNFIYDLREAVSEDDETQYSGAIHAECDLDIGGKGSLTVESKNNNGIHTKDDLEIKNLTLTVTCEDNALKGNDSVTVKSGTLKLIASRGDGIKTSNTDVSDKGNQRGTVEILGGVIDIYAACDGIDAAYDVVINESEATVTLNIYTDQYSEYSEEVSVTSGDRYYIRYTSKNYSYSIKWYNSDTDYKWVNAEYYTSVSYSRSAYYYYSIPIETGYSSFKFFMYSSTQQQGSEEEYTVCSDYITWNTACDTFALSKSGSSVKYSWTNYTTSSSGGMGGMGGMQDGNSNKSEYSTKGLKAGNAITISAGTVHIKAYDDAIHANADTTLENGASSTGNVTVSGGTLTLYSADDGIHADGTLRVSGGSINITKCYEGLEGAYIHVTNGSVSIVSSDDGINSPATSGTGIRISGGTVYIYANGDGIDSNSRTSYSGIVLEGGKVLVISTSNGNSAMDTEAGYSYTGGSVLAIMPSGGMTSESTKCNNTSAMAKKTISLSSGSYLTVSVSSTTVVTVKMPCSLSAMVIYLGNSSASMTSSSSSSAVLEENGVAWN